MNIQNINNYLRGIGPDEQVEFFRRLVPGLADKFLLKDLIENSTGIGCGPVTLWVVEGNKLEIDCDYNLCLEDVVAAMKYLEEVAPF